jgi:hypothetical protein
VIPSASIAGRVIASAGPKISGPHASADRQHLAKPSPVERPPWFMRLPIRRRYGFRHCEATHCFRRIAEVFGIGIDRGGRKPGGQQNHQRNDRDDWRDAHGDAASTGAPRRALWAPAACIAAALPGRNSTGQSHPDRRRKGRAAGVAGSRPMSRIFAVRGIDWPMPRRGSYHP